MTEFEVGGFRYHAQKMSAMRQLHVGRRIAPVIARMGSLAAIPGLVDAARPTAALPSEEAEKVNRAAEVFDLGMLFTPVCEALAALSDADTEYVVAECLMACKREEAGGILQTVWNRAAKMPQFADIELPQLLEITARVLMENIGGFFGASGLHSAAQSAPR